MIGILKRLVWEGVRRLKLTVLCRRVGLKTQSSQISTKANYGKGVRVGKNVVIDDQVSIGDYSYINRNSSIEKCSIGKFCSISEGVKINPVEHNYRLRSTHPVLGNNGHYGQENEPVEIGNDVLISLNAIILSGVKISDGAVIGAGAVVTKDIPPYAIVAGVPARVIKFRFEQAEIDKLEQMKWWDWPMEKIRRNILFLRRETDVPVDRETCE